MPRRVASGPLAVVAVVIPASASSRRVRCSLVRPPSPPPAVAGASPARSADPYRVWLSEIMLQQTTVAAVIPYYEKFVRRFPTVQALAAAPLEDVLAAWAGPRLLRPRPQPACVCPGGGGAAAAFRADLEGLRALPGIGAYTAAAIGAIAFGIPAVPVDGNVERVAARVFAIERPLPAAKPAICAGRRTARRADRGARRGRATSPRRCSTSARRFARPTSPACGVCPWIESCAARRAGIAAELPRKAPKKPRPLRYGVHFWLTDAAGQVLLRRRPPPRPARRHDRTAGHRHGAPTPGVQAEALATHRMPPTGAPAGEVRHGFTHFELTHRRLAPRASAQIEADGFLRRRRPAGRGSPALGDAQMCPHGRRRSAAISGQDGARALDLTRVTRRRTAAEGSPRRLANSSGASSCGASDTSR